MEYCSSDTFCCYGGTCDCSTGFNVTTFTEAAVAFTTIGVPGSGTTATSSSASTSLTSSTTERSTSTSSEAITDANTGTATSAGASQTTSSSAAPSPTPSNRGLSTGAKAGIGVGAALGAVLIAVIGFLFWRTNRQHKELEGLKAQREPLQPDTQDQPRIFGPAELNAQSITPAWSNNTSPSKGYYHSGHHSTSTPSNPSELHG